MDPCKLELLKILGLIMYFICNTIIFIIAFHYSHDFSEEFEKDSRSLIKRTKTIRDNESFNWRLFVLTLTVVGVGIVYAFAMR